LRYIPRTAAGTGAPGGSHLLHRLFVGGVAPSVGNGGGFGVCFTGCLLEELRVCWHRWWFWNLLHRLFVGGVARLLASVVVLEFASQIVCWRSCASVGIGGGFGICFTGCLLEELCCLLATVGFWNLLHGLFVGGEAEE